MPSSSSSPEAATAAVNGGRERGHPRPIHSLVLDTAPLLTLSYVEIKAFNATRYYTVPLAREEIRDESARAALGIWGDELRIRQPLAKSIHEGMYRLSCPQQTHSLQSLPLRRKPATIPY